MDMNAFNLTPILSWRWFPALLQWATVAVFAAILAVLFFGPAHANLGLLLTWLVWWPLLAVSILFVSRLWCAVCPFSAVSDLVQRGVGNRLRVPRFVSRNGLWIMVGAFMVLTWAEIYFDIVESPLGTGVLLLCILTGVVAMGAFFERRAWCRYMCPLGAMTGLYARVAMVELRGDPARCRECRDLECFQGSAAAPGCPLFEVARGMDSNANCSLCGNCVKNCPDQSLRLRLRPPGVELAAVRRPRLPDAVFIGLLLGLITGLNFFEAAEFAAATGLRATLTLLVFLGGGLAAQAACGRAAGRRLAEAWPSAMTRFAYALVPLLLAAHIGHTGTELLLEGHEIPVAVMAGADEGSRALPAWQAWLMRPTAVWLVAGFHALVLAGGWALTLGLIRRIAARAAPDPAQAQSVRRPWIFLASLFAVVNLSLALLGLYD